jgi:hypothetical protein
MVNILDGLIILAVHVENVQERLVDVLITLEPALHTRGNKPIRYIHTYTRALHDR